MRWPLGVNNADIASRRIVVPFPVDPRTELRRRAADRAIVDQLGHVKAIAVAGNADQVTARAALMLAARDRTGQYRYTPAQVLAALADWHAAHHYPTLQAVSRG